MIAQREQQDATLALYTIFKEEVYHRREQMMRWTAIGAGSLVTLLLIILLIPSARLLTIPARLLLASGSLLLALTFGVMLWQQHTRHRQAKQQLIRLEEALALFEEGHRPDNHSIYPAQWQTDWAHDRSLAQYLGILALLTILILVAVMLPAQ